MSKTKKKTATKKTATKKTATKKTATKKTASQVQLFGKDTPTIGESDLKRLTRNHLLNSDTTAFRGCKPGEVVAYNRLHDRLTRTRKHEGASAVSVDDAKRLLAIEVTREKGAREDTVSRLRQYIWHQQSALLNKKLASYGVSF